MTGLIVNADDFGRSPQVNAAVLLAHRRGVLTSASLMVAEPGAAAAAAIARDCLELDVGLHLVACNGRSVLPPRLIGGIVDDSGCFPRHEAWAGVRYALHRGLRTKLRDEFRAQIERHLELIGRLYHIDGHHNLHLHPVLADILIDLAREYRVPCVRLVREPISTTLALNRDHCSRKLRDHVIYRWLSRRIAHRLPGHGIQANDCLFGFHQTGELSESYVLGVLERLQPNCITEFYFHPAVEAGGHSPMRPSQVTETQILTSPRVRDAVEKLGISLMTFRELADRGRVDPQLGEVSRPRGAVRA